MSKRVAVDMSDQDFIRLKGLGKEYSMSPAQLLKQFVADLTNGKEAQGSDEQDLAYGWYLRTSANR